ncbi:RNA polymerase sigma factor [Irregularibacter muris]|uniref:RNA polymerase sigma factor n=1 Tax=Irregularibacter muris TaxID=1796619 RepID=A0AAE3L025_9FIRM|nr:RNA polymerase sigma factor [Irregularibacter muris]MCR1899147.1 RNA polymerase sigma factor [Irregularibacter muris]
MNEELQWIKQIRLESNKMAANKLITKYYKEIYAYIYRQTLNKELSMDLTQEIFIRVLQSISNYDEKKASFRTWLYRISTYRIVDYYRSKHYKYNSLETSINDYDIKDNEDFTISVEYKEDVEKIMEVVNKLDISNQRILRLKLFADYTFKEISEILGLSESTVKTKYYSTVKRIKKDLKEW